MAEHASEKITVEASVEACYAVLLEFEQYPEWVPDLKAITVVERDDQGRGAVVEFRAAAMGKSTTYQLRYDYEGAPNRLAWTLEKGDVERSIDGAYLLADSGDGATEVTYELSIELVIPLLGFVKRRAEERIIRAALPQLKARVEASAG
jgi:ribosome-associated toxin RatA of RatAB toxin-antitoxin module